ncbi:MAG: c-type cytochrome [Chitinophagales bacterium]
MARLISFLVMVIVFMGCASDAQHNNSVDSGNSYTLLPGEQIYMDNCKLCHGKNGGLGLSGASDLRSSTLDTAQVISVLTNGRNAMASFKGILTEEEINAVAAYVQNLKNQY